ncbi:hypothetical protein [Ruthenibacterium lactatiformans]|uniref:hypothetical protein n=1 Tax=Ruthenibacterium lactatiformans TaxID=1550024 RepID=UPI001058C11E|nr:hypothetical protein [Ruthenibacterium lactatiformans]
MSKKKDPKLYELILDWTQSGNLLWKRLDDEETNDPFVKRATDDMNIDLIEILYLIFDYPHKHYTFKHFEI